MFSHALLCPSLPPLTAPGAHGKGSTCPAERNHLSFHTSSETFKWLERQQEGLEEQFSNVLHGPREVPEILPEVREVKTISLATLSHDLPFVLC